MNFSCGNMHLNFVDAVSYLTFPSFEKYKNLRHCFSTRLGGVSSGIYKSMNLNFNKGDKRENIISNFKILANAIGVDDKTFVASAQTHGTNIRRVGVQHRGIGFYKDKDIENIDGLITNEKNVTLVTYYADCVPLYFYDTKNHAIGLAHAGWRGTVNKIADKILGKMKDEFDSCTKNIVVGIGPSIGPCCFEVDFEVAEKFYKLDDLNPNEFINKSSNGKYLINLWEANKKILLKAGIEDKNIEIAKLCTSCNDGLLFSHRKTQGKRGGMAAILSMILI